MNITFLLVNLEQSIGLPMHIILLIPISVALAFHILRASDGKKQLADIQDWDGDKNEKYKPSTIAMLGSLIFIVYAVFVLNQAVNNHANLTTMFTNIGTN